MNQYAERTIQRIKALIKQIAKLVDQLPKRPSTFRIVDQIMGSSTSIGANFTEAQHARSKKEFISTLGIAVKEAHETIFWLDTIKDLELASATQVNPILVEASEISKILTSAILTSLKINNHPS